MLLAVLISARPAHGFQGTAQTQTAAVVSRTLTGQVVNAATGAPISRALVSVNSRSMMTDSQGKFSFDGFTDTQAYAGVQKPGFAQDPEQGEGARMQKVADLDSPLILKLFPDALLHGTVTGPDALPLSRTQVRLRRLIFDTNGPRWQSVAFTLTDSHGEYRFRQPAGRYRITTGYTAQSQELGQAVLPTSFPQVSSTPLKDFFEVAVGEDRVVDLHPRTGIPRPVLVVLDAADSPQGTRVSASTGAGISFPVAVQFHQDGPAQMSLPPGTYTVRAYRDDSREEALEGSTRLTVTTGTDARATIHLAPMAAYPVETNFDMTPVSGSTTVPTVLPARQLNLLLQNLANDGDLENADVRLGQQDGFRRVDNAQDQPATFRLRPGRYRLAGRGGGAWYVRAASCGATNLLTEDLVVAADSVGLPIRLDLSYITGTLHGNVTADSQAATGWLYLVPRGPSLVPYYEVVLQPDGTYRWTGPPGTYAAVASARQMHEDFRSPEFLRSFLANGKSVEVSAGADNPTDLTMNLGAKR